IARYRVNAPALYTVIVVGAEQDLGIHVPVGDQAVIPFGGIAMLAPGDKRRALFVESFERFGREEFKISLRTRTILYCQTILAQSMKADLIKVHVAFRAEVLDLSFAGVFGFDRSDRLL